MRKVSEVTNIPFPFNDSTCCPIYISKDGSFHQIYKGKELEYYNSAKEGSGNIIIVWPGKYRSDAFLVDDIEQYGRAKGFVQDFQESPDSESSEVEVPIEDFHEDFQEQDLDNFI